jgi:hypothetical protein
LKETRDLLDFFLAGCTTRELFETHLAEVKAKADAEKPTPPKEVA